MIRRTACLGVAVALAGCGGTAHVAASRTPAPLPEGARDVAVAVEPIVTPEVTTRELSLEEAVDLALEQNMDLVLARAREQVRRQGTRTALGGALPGVAIFGATGSTDGRVQGSFGNLQDVDFDSYRTGVSAFYSVNIGAQVHELLAARRESDAATLTTLSTEQRVLVEVMKLHQGLALARVGVQIAEQLVADSDSLVRIASARARGGIALGADVARAEAKLAADEQELAVAQQQWEAASVRLATALRLDPSIRLVPSAPLLRPLQLLPPTDAWQPVELLEGRPDVLAARRARAAASQRSLAAWWDLLGPELTARWNELDVGAERNELVSQTDRSIFISWTLSLDKLGRIGERSAEAHVAEAEVTRTRDRAMAEIQLIRDELDAARRSMPIASRGMEAAERSLRINRARYEGGTALAIEVLDAENALARARLNVARAIVQFNLGQARLLSASGQIDREFLGAGLSVGTSHRGVSRR